MNIKAQTYDIHARPLDHATCEAIQRLVDAQYRYYKSKYQVQRAFHMWTIDRPYERLGYEYAAAKREALHRELVTLEAELGFTLDEAKEAQDAISDYRRLRRSREESRRERLLCGVRELRRTLRSMFKTGKQR